MNRIGIVAMVALLAAMPMGVARAADLLTVPVSDGTMAIPVADPTYDWNGFYAGLYGVGRASALGGDQYGLGVDFGVNAQFDYVLIGGEIALEGLTGGAGDTTYLQATARGGVLVSENFLIYGTGGFGVDLGPPDESDALVGGGVEFAVSDGVSVNAQYLHGFPITGANDKDQVTLGANFHF